MHGSLTKFTKVYRKMSWHTCFTEETAKIIANQVKLRGT